MHDQEPPKNYRIPVDRDDNRIYYDIPDASKYTMRDDGVVFRKLKGNRLRQLKPSYYKRDGRREFACWRVTINKDNGKRCSFDPMSMLKTLEGLDSLIRELPANYMEHPELWVNYYLHKTGDVLLARKDINGELYFDPVPWKEERPNGTYKLERVLLRTFDYTRRSYTRQQLQEMYRTRMDDLVEALQEPTL